MNKLSKIAIVSSLSIFGAVTTVGGVLLAQEGTATTSQDIPVERTDGRSRVRDIDSPNRQRQDNQRVALPTQNQGEEIRDISPNQRINNQDNRSSQSSSTLTTEQREQKIRERCEDINNRISQHKERFQIRSQRRLDKYNLLLTRLESISQKLSDKGVEVTQYNSYIDELVGKINVLDTSIQEYIQGFSSEEVSICSNQKLAESINTKRESLKSIVSQEKELRLYIKDTIIPYLRSLKPQDIVSPDSTTNQSEAGQELAQ